MNDAPHPFAYPSAPHTRRHAPIGYADHSSYKPWLRDEFTFRCVYCLEREAWYPNRSDGFGVDHFAPAAVWPDRRVEYTNLVYACNRCNAYKNSFDLLPDPVQSAYSTHLIVNNDGEIQGLTSTGDDIIEAFHLDEDRVRKVRQQSIWIRQAMQEHPDDPLIRCIFLARFGYPSDLPDLRRLRPPQGNANPGSEHSCYFAKREQGLLAETY